jgi:rRNA maturation protein Nop10
VKECTPIPCPSFEEKTLVVEKCPTCGSAVLKWDLTQEFECQDDFHNSGLIQRTEVHGQYPPPYPENLP